MRAPDARLVNVGGEQEGVPAVPGHAADLVGRARHLRRRRIQPPQVVQPQQLLVACMQGWGFQIMAQGLGRRIQPPQVVQPQQLLVACIEG